MAENPTPGEAPADEGQYDALDRYAENLRDADARSEVIEGVPPMYMRGALYLLAAVMACLLIISWFGKIHVIVKGKGLLVPEAENVVLEAQEGGVVKTVDARPGEVLKKGQLVLTLEKPQSQVALSTLTAELGVEKDRLRRANRARELALSVAKNPKSVLRTDPRRFADADAATESIQMVRRARQSLARAEDDLRTEFTVRKKNALEQIRINDASIRKIDETIAVTRGGLKTREQDLEAKRSAFKQMETLAGRRAVPLSTVNQAREAMIQSEASLYQERQRIGQLELERARLLQQSNETRTGLERQKSNLENQRKQAKVAYEEALGNLNGAIALLDQQILKSRAKVAELEGRVGMQRVQIKELQVSSPEDGVLTDLKFSTPGQLVERGARVGTFVPSQGKTIAIVYIENKDAAAVKPGVRANIKVDAFPYRQFGTVRGKVLSSFPMPDKPQFKVRIELEQDTIRGRGGSPPNALKPGYTVETDLLTERKRIIQLVLSKFSGSD